MITPQDTLYHDQPIPKRNAPPPAADCPPRLLEMQRLALQLTLRAPAERIFYEQARLMADYEDERPWRGKLFRERPTYTSLTLAQLRGYFTWRGRVRMGIFERAPQPFALLYMQELIHLVGADTAEEAFRLLLDFRLHYRPLDFGMAPFCRIWLRDLVLYYALDSALLRDIPPSGEDLFARSDRRLDDKTRQLLPLVCRDEHPPEVLGEALMRLARHKVAASPVARAVPERFRAALGRAFVAVMDEWEAREPGLKLLGDWASAPYELFKGAVFADPLADAPGRDSFRLNTPDGRFCCEQGRWRQERFFLLRDETRREQRKLLAALVRVVDSRLRLAWGFLSALKPTMLPLAWFKLVDTAVRADQAARDEARQQEALRLPIDLSRLADIRADADRTRDRLIVPGGADDEGDDDRIEATEATEAPPVPTAALTPPAPLSQRARGVSHPSPSGRGAGGEGPHAAKVDDIAVPTPPCPLSPPEQTLLRTLLTQTAPTAPPGQSLALLVDAINDKLFERFGDTVIVFEDERPRIPEEYHQELQTLLGP